MFGFNFGGVKIVSKGVKLILTCLMFSSRIDFAFKNDSNLKLQFGAFTYIIDFQPLIYCSTHFHQNQFYTINPFKIIFCHAKPNIQ